jgi:hypothetical protein
MYGHQGMLIEEWWGRAADFPSIVAAGRAMPSVKLDFGNWKGSHGDC